MDNLEAAGRLVLRAVKLSEFDIRYHLKTVTKAQALANFITEFITGETDDCGATPWKVQIDGSSNKCAEGIKMVLQSPKGDIIECFVRLQFPTTNNEVEYETILRGLNLARVARFSLVVLHSIS